MGSNNKRLQIGHRELKAIRIRAQESLESGDRPAEAAELFGVLVRAEPDDGLAWLNLGDSLRLIGRYREAEEALLTARELAPKARRFTVDARLGMVLTKSNSPSDAEKWFRLATSNSECPGWVWVLRAANLIRKESNKLARECLKAAKTRDDVDLDEVLLNEALIDRCEGDYASATRKAEEALRIDPDSQAAKVLLASLQSATDAKDFAIQLTGANARKPD